MDSVLETKYYYKSTQDSGKKIKKSKNKKIRTQQDAIDFFKLKTTIRIQHN